MSQNAEIIMVEDNLSDADLVKRSLKKNNIANKLVHLEDGQQALDYIFSEGEWAGRDNSIPPRVILLDLKMPKVSGMDVLRRLKAHEETMTIPVVVLTSSKEDPDIQECYKLGANSYVVKPVDFDAFVKVISHLGLYWLIINHGPKK